MIFCFQRRPSLPWSTVPLSLAALWAFFLVLSLHAQKPAPADAPIATLHAYADLIQIPVLVLDHNRRLTPRVDPSRFSITLDSGRPFRPTYIRREGDDPITLSILLDVDGLDRGALPKIDQTIANLAPLSLRAHDRVTLYALDCSLNTVTSISPPDVALLSRSVDAVLQPWRSGPQKKKTSGCAHPIELWDTLYYLAHQIGPMPGRRIILVISSGIDHGSRMNWNQTRTYAQAEGVSVFGVRYQPIDIFGRAVYFHPPSGEKDFFSAICELSGGIVLPSNDDDMPGSLDRVLQMVRDRYIVEFPRPKTVTAGPHDIFVAIDKSSNAFIRPGGISVPLPDPAVFTNPATPLPDPEKSPDLGTRRILLPNPPNNEQ